MERTDIDALAEACSAAGDRLLEDILRAEARALEDAAGLRTALADYDAARARLSDAAAAAPTQFQRPRSRLVAGLRFGLRKASPTARPDDLVKLLRDAGLGDLVKTKESVLNTDLAKLPRKTLRKLGVRIEGGEDEPLVERVRDNLEERLAHWRPLLAQ